MSYGANGLWGPVIFLIAGSAALDVSSAAPTQDSFDVTFEDLRSGYWLNYEEFNSLVVSWRYIQFPHENALRRYEESWKSQPPEQRAALAKASGRREEQNEFWSDRVAFQVRTPAVLVPDRDAPGRSFRFPSGAARAENLMTDFHEIAIYNFSGRLSDGIRFWNGVLDGKPQAAILSSLNPGSVGSHLPPLALRHPVAGFVQHPFDEFFSQDPQEARVVDRTNLDGRDLYVVEKAVTEPNGRTRLRLLVEEAGKDINKLTLQTVLRAWIDMDRGCLPLRIEKTERMIYDGRTYDDIWANGPSSVIVTHEIEKKAGGGFYPTRVSLVGYGADTRTAKNVSLSFDKMISGLPEMNFVPEREVQWVAQAVESGRDLTGFFAFEFPESTVYFDERNSRVVGRTYDPLPARGAAALARRPGAANGSIRPLLIAANVVLVALLILIIAVRRWHAIRGR
jgi:hypothetical protein